MTTILPKKCAIIGAGAVGLYFAELLAKSFEVRIIAKSSQLEQWGRKEFKLAGKKVPLQSLDAFSPAREGEIIWLCVKAYDLDGLVAKLKPQLNQNTPLVLLSNGLGIYFQVATDLGKLVPILRMLPTFGLKLNDFKVECFGTPAALFAYAEQDSALAQALHSKLSQLGLALTLEKNIATAEWRKALVNLVVNTLATCLDRENGSVIETPDLEQIAAQMLDEARQVAKADGFDLSSPSNDQIFANIRQHAANINSNLIDLRNRRKSDMEYLMGRFITLAQSYGVPIPCCQAVYAIYKFIERRATTSIS